MTEKMQLESLNRWWNERNLFQKQLVLVILEELAGAAEGEVLETREPACKMEIQVMMCPDECAYRSNCVNQRQGPETTGCSLPRKAEL